MDNYYLLAERQNKLVSFSKNKNLYKYTNRNVDMYNIVENILEKHHYLLDEKIIIKELDNYQKENHYDFRYKELTIVPNVIELSLIKRIADICVKEDKKIKEAKRLTN